MPRRKSDAMRSDAMQGPGTLRAWAWACYLSRKKDLSGTGLGWVLLSSYLIHLEHTA